MSLFSSEDSTIHIGWVGGLVAILSLVLPAAGVAGKWLYDRWREGRKDVISEWQEIAHKVAADLDVVRKELVSHQTDSALKISVIMDDLHKCEINKVRQEGQIAVLQSAVRWLQGLSGDGPPAIISPTVVVMDLTGKVRIVSPTITPLLHWMPADLLGKSIELIIPEAHREARRDTLLQIKLAGEVPWPGKVIQSIVLSKEGTEVPVAIVISAWPDETAGGNRLVCWEMARRVATP